MYLLVLAHPGSPGQRLVKWMLLLYDVCSQLISILLNYYIRQVNGVKLADILFSHLCVCLCVSPSVCTHF